MGNMCIHLGGEETSIALTMDTNKDEGGTRSYSIRILIIVALADFTDNYIEFSVVPILPFILKNRVGIDESQLQKWVSALIAIYAAAYIFGSPLVGWISDRPGLRKRVYIGGLLLTAISTAAFAMARSMWVLVLGRVSQALSSAVVRCAGMAMLKDSADTNTQGRVMGFLNIPFMLGVLAGPVVSGWLYEKVSYGAVWIVIGVILLLDIIARLFVSDIRDTNQNTPSCSPNGASQRFGDPRNDHGRNHEDSPLLPQEQATTSPRSLLRTFFFDQRVLTALWLIFVGAFLRNSLASTLPLFVNHAFNAKSGKTGGLYLALSIPLTGSLFIGMLFDRYGAFWINASGLAIGIASFLCLRFISYDSPTQVAVLMILLLLCGITIMFVTVSSMAVCATVASELVNLTPRQGHPINISGQVLSAIFMTMALGQILGPIIAAVLVDQTGWTGLTAVLGALCIGSFLAVISIRVLGKN